MINIPWGKIGRKMLQDRGLLPLRKGRWEICDSKPVRHHKFWREYDEYNGVFDCEVCEKRYSEPSDHDKMTYCLREYSFVTERKHWTTWVCEDCARSEGIIW